MKRIALTISCFILLLFSCKKDVDVNTYDTGKNYFPLVAGSYIIYDVDSTYYDDFYIPSKIKNSKFQLKEKIQSLYYDNQNRLTARLERYIKHYDSLTPYSAIPWTLKNVWAQNVTATSAEKVEENVRLIKLIFSVKLNAVWNVNAQNYLSEKDFSYTAVNQAETIGGIYFDSVTTTTSDDGGAILTSRNYHTEKYAKNIGLIYKNVVDIQSQPDPSYNTSQLQLFYAKPIMQRITSGYQYTWTVVAYGKE